MVRDVAFDPTRRGGYVRQAVVLQLALPAALVIGRLRQNGHNELFPDLPHGVHYLAPQRRGELNANPASRPAVPDRTLRHIDAKHLLKA